MIPDSGGSTYIYVISQVLKHAKEEGIIGYRLLSLAEIDERFIKVLSEIHSL